MGIFGALTTAVSGLRAQSYALENISGNIANSQTTAFKRTDTSFTDLIPDALPSRQVAGAVISQSRATNSVQGDIQSATNDTYMALNGEGYFVVATSNATADGQPIFSGTDYYTRRGDFEMNKEGFLVNKAGYYLKLLPIDRNTGNVSGSVPEVMPLNNDILPARSTDVVTYRANLPKTPTSGLLQSGAYAVDPRVAGAPVPISQTGAVMNATLIGAGGDQVSSGSTIQLQIPGETPVTFTIATGGIETLAQLRDAINASTELDGITATITGGALQLSSTNPNISLDNMAVTGSAANLGIVDDVPTASAGGGYVQANNATIFEAQSIPGDAVTIYDEQGTPVEVQFRWAKTNSTETGGVDTWNLFYKSDTSETASGTDPVWTNAGTNFTFGSNSLLSPPIASINIPGLTVNGVNVGDVTLAHGTTGLTQFTADNNTTADILQLNQDGYAAGEVVRIQISDGGRITAFYSNGQMADIAEIPTVYFNADNMLKRLDGGAFATTFESGPPIPGAPGSIVGQALEGSNTDIADEFTKLIITQQAYSANTRIVSTADEMLQEALNMIR
jgi:flagellar hook protein FlgE